MIVARPVLMLHDFRMFVVKIIRTASQARIPSTAKKDGDNRFSELT